MSFTGGHWVGGKWEGFPAGAAQVPDAPPEVASPKSFGGLWNMVQSAAPSRLAISRQSGISAIVYEHTVKNGDVATQGGGNRTELVASDPTFLCTEGKVKKYTWKTRFPSAAFAIEGSKWGVFTQFHQASDTATSVGGTSSVATPLIQWIYNSGTLRCWVMADRDALFHELWSAAITLDHWYTFVFDVCWSDVANVGYTKLTVDGTVVAPQTAMRTLGGDVYAYLKQGIYRDPTHVADQTIWHSGMTCVDVN